MTTRPKATEYAPYYGKYISLVPDGDIVALLEEQLRGTTALLSAVSEQQADYRYAPEKWTVKQVLGHLTDTERIFAYRALRISRHDATPIEGFEQDDYVRYGPFEICRMTDLVEDFAAVRRATLSLFRRLDAEAWQRRGTANQNEVTVRALAYCIAGHELHHLAILKDKYRLVA
ncbi:MAG TPA: DinB family protein [Terriglobia bacterium]|nr:DinB family protein [Terriglobia bacterium]